MGFDINLVKARLQKLQTKGQSEKIDYKKLFFKPQLGKQTIRIVPNKFNKDFPFTEVVYHNSNTFKKSIYSLENWGEKDPIVQLAKELYNDSDPETKAISEETAKKLSRRSKAYAQVIVRGRESEGVLLWEMNKTTYESLLTIAAQDDEYGDITDLMEGTDLVVEGYNASIMVGKKKVDYIAVNLTPKRKPTPLSEDQNQIEKWLEEQKNPFELYKKYTYEEIKNILKAWLDPETTDNNKEQEESESVPEAPKSVTQNSSKDEDDDDAPFEPDNKPNGVVTRGNSSTPSSKQKFAEMFDDEDDE